MVRIYLLWNEVGEYVGSTVNTIHNRKVQHELARTKFKCSSSILFADGRDANIELLEECSEDLRYERERYWMGQFPNRVNVRLPGRPSKERSREIIQCEFCNKSMRRNSNWRHIRRMHPPAEK